MSKQKKAYDLIASSVGTKDEQQMADWLKSIIKANQQPAEGTVKPLDNCPGHEGECGSCVGFVWVPCG